MDSYERVMARLKGEPVDRVPNLCILMGFAAKYAGVCYRDFCLCPEKMVEANLKCHRDFHVDIVTVMSDPYGEAMDYGMEVQFPEDANPQVVRYFWNSDEADPDALPQLTMDQTHRMRDRVRAIELYAQQIKGECPIAGWVEGAVAEYCDLRNINLAMMDFAMEEEYVAEILEKITQQDFLYIEKQVEAGADIIGIGDAACSLMGPELYAKYGFPYEKQMVDKIHQCGALAKLHICGNINPLLPKIAELGADIVDADWAVDFAYAAKTLKGVSSVNGNFDPVSIMMSGTPETIRRSILRCLEEGGSRCLISAGCEVPRDTPDENLMTVFHTLSFPEAR